MSDREWEAKTVQQAMDAYRTWVGISRRQAEELACLRNALRHAIDYLKHRPFGNWRHAGMLYDLKMAMAWLPGTTPADFGKTPTDYIGTVDERKPFPCYIAGSGT